MSGNNQNNCKNRIKWLDDQDVIRADVAKLHNEINQLRNQELLINSFAVTAVAILATVPTRHILLSTLYLLILLGIGYWQHTILLTRARLTEYLKVFGLSQWEKDYSGFTSIKENKYPSMRRTTAVLFVILGFCVLFITLIAIFNNNNNNPIDFNYAIINKISLIGWVLIAVFFIILSCYIACCITYGFLCKAADRESIKAHWETIKGKKEKEDQIVISSTLISPEYTHFSYKSLGHYGQPDVEFNYNLRTRKQSVKTTETTPESAQSKLEREQTKETAATAPESD